MSFEKPNSSSNSTLEQGKTLRYLEGMEITTQVLSTITKETQKGLEITQQLLDVLKLMREWSTQEQKQEKTNLPSVVEQALKDLPKSPENSETIADYLAEEFDGILRNGQKAKEVLKQLVNDSTRIPEKDKYKVTFHYYTQINQRVKTLLQDLLVKVQLELLVQKTEEDSQQIKALITGIQKKIESLQQNLKTVSGQLRFSNPDPSNTKSLEQEQDPSQMTINVKYEPVTEGETDDWNQPYQQQQEWRPEGKQQTQYIPGWESPKAWAEWSLDSRPQTTINDMIQKSFVEYGDSNMIDQSAKTAKSNAEKWLQKQNMSLTDRSWFYQYIELSVEAKKLELKIQGLKNARPRFYNVFASGKTKKIDKATKNEYKQLAVVYGNMIGLLESKRGYYNELGNKVRVSFTFGPLREERLEQKNKYYQIAKYHEEDIRHLRGSIEKMPEKFRKKSKKQEIPSLASVGDNSISFYEGDKIPSYNSEFDKIPGYEDDQVDDNYKGDQFGYEPIHGTFRVQKVSLGLITYTDEEITYAQINESALPKNRGNYHVLGGGLEIGQQYTGTEVTIDKFEDLIEVKDPSTETTYHISISNDQENETLNVHKLDRDGKPVHVENENKLPFYAKRSSEGTVYSTFTLVSKEEELMYKTIKKVDTYDFTKSSKTGS